MSSIPRIESVKKSALKLSLRRVPNSVMISHEDFRTSGTPDLSWTILQYTIWIEVKHATPRCDSMSLQERQMRLLALFGIARYVVYYETEDQRQTLIINPCYFEDWHAGVTVPIEASCEGHQNHRFVIKHLLSLIPQKKVA